MLQAYEVVSMRLIEELFSMPLRQIPDMITALSITDIILLIIAALAVIWIVLRFLRVTDG